MSLIHVKVRLAEATLYDTKVYVKLEEPVRLLKKKICEKDESLQEKLIIVFYCGNVLEDCNPLYTYDLFEGAMVHVFKEIEHENENPCATFTDSDLVKLGVAFRSLTLNSTYTRAMRKVTKPEAINNLILTTPGLNNDPVAFTLLRHPELLSKLSDFEVVKRLSIEHPALASAALQIASNIHDELQTHFDQDILSRSIFNAASDEDIEDMDDSSPASEASSQPVSRNSSFGAITAAQLASAIASVTTQQQLPSSSGASTSTGSTSNVLEALHNVQSQPTLTEIDISTQLQIMRDMGLTNDAINLEALRLSNDLETAIELVLSGFTITDNDFNN